MMKVNRIVCRDPDLRIIATDGVLSRINRLEQIDVKIIDSEESLHYLKKRGCLLSNEDDLFYVPSYQTRQTIFSQSPFVPWDEKILKKQKKAFRMTDGAIITFPLEDEEGHIEAFITDWSPLPAAAAIALHPSHWLVSQNHNCDNCFIDKFVRNPLTGDLMPVWVANWVRPDFGTGAVVVNPAHSMVDYEYAKKIGFPIRFALSEQKITANPDTWLSEPIVKLGRTVRTGAFDGLSVEDASQKYFQELYMYGMARKYTDCSIGAIKIVSNNSAESFFETILKIGQSESFDLCWPSWETDNSLLFSRLLYHDLYGQSLTPNFICFCQKADYPNLSQNNTLLGFESLVSAPMDQVGVVKQQLVEQCQRFLQMHNKMILDLDQSIHNIFYEIFCHLIEYKYNIAFSKIYKLQKELSANNNLSPSVYFVLVHVLTGLTIPPEINASEVWKYLCKQYHDKK